jgi:SAM-dependent methyltransferase
VQLDVPLAAYHVNDYDAIAEVFDISIGDDYLDITFDAVVHEIRRTLGVKSGIRHLDIGCGTGSFVIRLAQTLGSESFGIDLSSRQIATARSKARSLGIDATFRVGDMLSVSLPTNCDLVTSNYDSINHLPTVAGWHQLFRRVRACLKQNGYFLFDVNLPKRLDVDWNCPEIIMKPDVTYLQVALGRSKHGDVVRRRILMQIFSNRSTTFNQRYAVVEQIAVPAPRVFGLLTKCGFSASYERRVSNSVRNRHLFMKNRLFVTARA